VFTTVQKTSWRHEDKFWRFFIGWKLENQKLSAWCPFLWQALWRLLRPPFVIYLTYKFYPYNNDTETLSFVRILRPSNTDIEAASNRGPRYPYKGQGVRVSISILRIPKPQCIPAISVRGSIFFTVKAYCLELKSFCLHSIFFVITYYTRV